MTLPAPQRTRDRTALVTGGTGLVGSHIVERLLADGWTVRALVRDPGRAGWLSRHGVAVLTGDVTDGMSIEVAARGCGTIFHTAAAITQGGGWEDFDKLNVYGTRNVIKAAGRTNSRLLHLSSVAVYGAGGRYAPDGVRTAEDAPLETLPPVAHYARSKRESEALVLDAHAKGRIWATAVRPDVVYGIRDRQFVPRIARLLRFGIAPLVGDGKTTLAIVHAANVADGAVRAATTEVAGGQAYNLANDYDVSVEEFFRLAAEGLDRPMRVVHVPMPVARAGMAVARVVAGMTGSGVRFALDASLDFVTRDNPFTSERARAELGWDPPVRPEVGIPQAFRWWKKHH